MRDELGDSAVGEAAAAPASEDHHEQSSSSSRDDHRPLLRRWREEVVGNWQVLTGGAFSVLLAVVLLTRFSIHAALTRDQSIYVYGAQRFSHGVAPYVSIFDPKTPGSTILGGIAATVAHWFHLHDLIAIRATFFLCALATVAAAYALAYRLWSSIPAAIATAATLCCFTVFARSGLVGPEAKLPGLMFAVLAMYAMARRRWVWAAVLSGLAFDFWQPYVWFGLVAVVGGVLHASRGRRLRNGLLTFAGAAAPTVLLAIYFAAKGALSQFLVAAFEYPLTGTVRDPETLGEHFLHPARVIDAHRFSAVLVWTGVGLLLGLVVLTLWKGRGGFRAALLSPVVFVVFVTFLLNVFYAFYDFQSDPDTVPLLVYPALGIGGAIAYLARWARNVGAWRYVAVPLTAVGLVVVSVSWVLFGNLSRTDRSLKSQLASACGLTTLLGKDGVLVSLGDPMQFALTHRVSPTNFIYLAAGVDDWKIKHTPGGFFGWFDQIIAWKPSIVAINGWDGPGKRSSNVHAMYLYLHAAGYERRFLGRWELYVDQPTRDTAAELGVELTRRRTDMAMRPEGDPLPPRVPCGIR